MFVLYRVNYELYGGKTPAEYYQIQIMYLQAQ